MLHQPRVLQRGGQKANHLLLPLLLQLQPLLQVEQLVARVLRRAGRGGREPWLRRAAWNSCATRLSAQLDPSCGQSTSKLRGGL